MYEQLTCYVHSGGYKKRCDCNPPPSHSYFSTQTDCLVFLDLLHLSTKRLQQKTKKHTTGGIPRWSPTLVLVARFSAYVWQSGRDAQFSLTYGRMYLEIVRAKYDVLNRGTYAGMRGEIRGRCDSVRLVVVTNLQRLVQRA
jgi:hypothetical protein